MPRRSGTMTVWSFTSAAANGAHMSPVSPKPCSITTAGPFPPTRTWIVAPSVLMPSVWKPGGNGRTSAEAESTKASAAIAPNTIRSGIADALFMMRLRSFSNVYSRRYTLNDRGTANGHTAGQEQAFCGRALAFDQQRQWPFPLYRGLPATVAIAVVRSVVQYADVGSGRGLAGVFWVGR